MQDGDEERDRSCEVKDDHGITGRGNVKSGGGTGGETMHRTAGGSPL